ncbi:general transcription factor II-I repeat domain-containing protein 2-like [Palaemon carinicauda]|uniref:general transcription factor II-I repeat domain-containing protein 2-like n=1 Tax=Palaemon carinicauda TaxID=392227 RepID=UPI0035B67477
MFEKTSSLQRNAIKASFVLANKIAKQNKSFAEAEFIKDCMVDAVSVVCPEVISKVEAISLSRRTIVRRIDAIAMNIQDQVLTASVSFQWFSIALDESNDIQNTAQVLIYIRGIDKNFEITEELLSMESLKDTVTGKDLYNSVINSLIRSRLSLDKLACITTDGAPSLIGKHCGLVTLMNDKIKEDFPSHSVLSFHCIIHQESLCRSSFKLKHVMDPVVRAVNLIRARGLNHRQFRSFLEDIESNFTDVLYHTNIRWLSMGKVLKRMWDVKEEVVLFFNMKDISCDFSREMECDEWQLKEQNFVHFPLLKTRTVTQALSDKYSYQLTAIRDEFIRRFADFKAIEGQFDLLSSPFACDVETAAEELQVELIDLQADNSLKRLFENKLLVEFYASLHSEKFINLKNFARKMAMTQQHASGV